MNMEITFINIQGFQRLMNKFRKCMYNLKMHIVLVTKYIRMKDSAQEAECRRVTYTNNHNTV